MKGVEIMIYTKLDAFRDDFLWGSASAAIKCPNSCTMINKPNPKIAKI